MRDITSETRPGTSLRWTQILAVLDHRTTCTAFLSYTGSMARDIVPPGTVLVLGHLPATLNTSAIREVTEDGAHRTRRHVGTDPATPTSIGAGGTFSTRRLHEAEIFV